MASFPSSWVCIGDRLYGGLSANISSLPLDTETGTKAYCIDTGALYIYESTTYTWYLQPSSGGNTDAINTELERILYQ